MPLPVITVEQMRQWEKATWETGQTEAEVIRRVGLEVARHSLKLTRPGDLLLILAGKGHNGDDARAAREHLVERRVDLLEVGDPEKESDRLEALLSLKPALVIDGLFGIGLSRPLSSPWVRFIDRINRAGLKVLALDVPSGLDASKGTSQGAAVEASVTLTVGAPKLGMFSGEATNFVGRLEVARDVGLAPSIQKSELQWTLPSDFESYPPSRVAQGHKGTYGHLSIIAGSLGYHGAAVLTARGAQRAQPGLVTLYTQEPVYHPVAAQLQAVMVSPWRSDLRPGENRTAILIGPGLASPDVPREIQKLVEQVWRDFPGPVVIDASALAWIPPGEVSAPAVRVMTPHPGEAARLLQTHSKEVQADRITALRELSYRFGHCWVVLKGHQTLIGRSHGEIYVNPSGNPHLAQGGSGDVLSGYLAGLLAQPPLQRDALTALRYGVWQHGATADLLQHEQCNWVVEDLCSRLGQVRARAE
ncbi:MAG TPA: NAD(P)H-hydrate dehydratase [Verrucomicrobiae bacterium]|nr:NAD(P)H-hydrate dehydratase [Verrucomicrobiae bacterium]